MLTVCYYLEMLIRRLVFIADLRKVGLGSNSLEP